MQEFIKQNYLFIITVVASIISIIWLFVAPDFEPIVTTLLSVVTSINLRPKDWLLIQNRSINELPKIRYKENIIDEIELSSNIMDDNNGGSKFDWEKTSLDAKDKSISSTVVKSTT